MVGKPNFPTDVDERDDLKGAAAAPTPGLTALDHEREASLADEGGASGMVMEHQDPDCRPCIEPHVTEIDRKRQTFLTLLGTAAVVGFVFGLAIRR